MYAYLSGSILFCDGTIIILKTEGGIGFQISFSEVVPIGCQLALYVSHIFREEGQSLYGFRTLNKKNLFELLLSVKGIGPKSSYSLLQSVGEEQIVHAIRYDQKKILQKANGIGAKAAAQIILDLKDKIKEFILLDQNLSLTNYPSLSEGITKVTQVEGPLILELNNPKKDDFLHNSKILENALQACVELGFTEEKIIPLMQDILKRVKIDTPEKLVHAFLKEI